MVGTESVNVLKREVAVRGGHPIGTRRGWVSSYGPDTYSAGGHAVAWREYTTGTAVLELQRRLAAPGEPGEPETTTVGFDTHDEARAEFERLKAELFAREWVTWATTDLVAAGVLPAELVGEVLAGEPQALLVAADWQRERDAPDAALLLRAAYHRVLGEANVEEPAGKGVTVIYNPHAVTKRSPAVPRAAGLCQAVVVEAGTSVRIVTLRPEYEAGAKRPVPRVDVRTFRVGDPAEYDAFNLVYYGPVKSITAKTVVVLTDRYRDGATARLSLAKFVEKNHDFDLAKAQHRNGTWSD